MSRIYKLKRSVAKPHEKVRTFSDSVTLPASFSLRPKMPPALDQGQLGSCASNAMSNALRFLLTKEGRQQFQPSRLYLYWNTRVNIEKSPADQDTGVAINDLCAALQEYHACNETLWPYDISKFSDAPPLAAYKNADLHKNVKYEQVPQDITTIKRCLFQEDPVLIGIQVYDSFEYQSTIATGVVPLPDVNNENCLGGHCVLLVGWDDESERFTFLNSWGNVADDGYFTIPYEYVLDPNLGSDYWTVSFFE